MSEREQTVGDGLSRLIQLQARRHEIQLAWTGRGVEDLVLLMQAHMTKERLSRHLWVSVSELLDVCAVQQLPEAVHAAICSIILRARALTELENDAHAVKLAARLRKAPVPPGVA